MKGTSLLIFLLPHFSELQSLAATDIQGNLLNDDSTSLFFSSPLIDLICKSWRHGEYFIDQVIRGPSFLHSWDLMLAICHYPWILGASIRL